MSRHHDDERSRTQRKREAEALQATGEKLLALPAATLATLPIPEQLRDAILVARKLSQRGALRRQRQYIGRLMRELDTAALEDALATLEQHKQAENAVFHAAERWRDRLLEEGQAGLEAFFDAHPGADRQHLRHLARAAQRETAVRERRELFRALRDTLESGQQRDSDSAAESDFEPPDSAGKIRG